MRKLWYDGAWVDDDFFIQYDESTNTFQTVLDEQLGGISYAASSGVNDIVINDEESITIEYTVQLQMTGPLHLSYTYDYKDGEFERESNTASVVSHDNEFMAMKDLTFYDSPDGKEIFTLHDKDIAALEGFYSDDSGNYLIFKNNKKEGYIKLADNQQDSFYDISYVN